MRALLWVVESCVLGDRELHCHRVPCSALLPVLLSSFFFPELPFCRHLGAVLLLGLSVSRKTHVKLKRTQMGHSSWFFVSISLCAKDRQRPREAVSESKQ